MPFTTEETTLTDADLERVFSLWDELGRYPAHRQREANAFLMQSLSEWLDADYAYWVSLARLREEQVAAEDAVFGWRNIAVQPHVFPEIYRDQAEQILENQHSLEAVGLASAAIMSEAGEFRVRLLRDLVDMEEYEATDYFKKFQAPYGLNDRLYVMTPVGEAFESSYVFERVGDGRQIDRHTASLAGVALRGLRLFQDRLAMATGMVIGGKPLSPIETDILYLLLTDKPEKEIAAAIDRAHSTTHNYVTGIFRSFGVKNRAGLLSLWLANHAVVSDSKSK
ncbi:Bacterial regulatory protein, luxR family [Pseudobythopirellula maris]|uniref:Bacterial regulatory protein, luxR family n=2 Tax=Pseudobythopirellula maris TaxID=2527991 RepID=A0A5C5ZTT8_9BACT|nr:Bacterial regulatory protein, luxR family [Pseudobythopirellula maris]